MQYSSFQVHVLSFSFLAKSVTFEIIKTNIQDCLSQTFSSDTQNKLQVRCLKSEKLSHALSYIFFWNILKILNGSQGGSKNSKFSLFPIFPIFKKSSKQAGAELGQAQLKLGLGFTRCPLNFHRLYFVNFKFRIYMSRLGGSPLSCATPSYTLPYLVNFKLYLYFPGGRGGWGW